MATVRNLASPYPMEVLLSTMAVLVMLVMLVMLALATIWSLRMAPVSWNPGRTTRTRSLHAPPQNRSRLCSCPKVAHGARIASHLRLKRARGVGMGCLCHA